MRQKGLTVMRQALFLFPPPSRAANGLALFQGIAKRTHTRFSQAPVVFRVPLVVLRTLVDEAKAPWPVCPATRASSR
jgi:hypothetical protein